MTTRRHQSARNPQTQVNMKEDATSNLEEIDAGLSLEKAERNGLLDQRSACKRLVGFASQFCVETIPQWLAVGAMLGLIFGGCCSNVFVLEATIKVEPGAGTLLTFVQFLFVASTGYLTQFDKSRPPLFIAPNKVPIRRWLVNIFLFFSINVLNNHAFSYDISVPVHIILRSGGSITTMIAGSLWGKRYSRLQVTAVLLLTVGVVFAAWSDAQSKVPVSADEGSTTTNAPPKMGTGLAILFLAQILSSIMGLYTEETYATYGGHWKENLFYSHLLSLPLFLPFFPGMLEQLGKLANSPPLILPGLSDQMAIDSVTGTVGDRFRKIQVPSQLVYLALNVLTQYACVRGVNLLAAASSALTVTIVLNIRKLISLLLSIWLFGNRLAPGTMVGALIVFTAGGLYSLNSNTKKAPR